MKTLQPDWPAPANIKAHTTLRDTWGDYTHYPRDDRSDQSLKTLLQLPSDPVWITQKHTAIAVEAKPENQAHVADAVFTQETGRVCVVLTADCLPLLICNRQGTHVAAVHAGWRGLAGGVIEATLKNLQQPAEDLLVWLGPAIGPQKFEVGEDVFQAFTQSHPEAATAFQPHVPGKWFANLYALATLRLQSQGITHIYGGNYCTYTQDDLFYSYRRDKGHTGRMASVIWMHT